jgi:hypothetical protein
MPLYTQFESVRLRLQGKVQFDETGEDANKMAVALAKNLIDEAEAQVEQDLSPRYQTPFAASCGAGDYASLPLRPTQMLIKTLCEIMSTIRILETDFGRGTMIEGENYTTALQKRYDAVLEKILKRRDDNKDYNNWFYPPLPGLKPNWFNTEADDGYSGQVLNTSQYGGEFPAARINDPSQTFWNASFTEVDTGTRDLLP